MKPYRLILIFLVLGLAQAACALPTRPLASAETATPVFLTATVGTTATGAPELITATAQPTQTTAPTNTPPPPPTATTQPSATRPAGCTYLATFVADVTIPDDTRMAPGATFTKTWRVRNDGSCTWGPNQQLYALTFTGGTRLGTVDQVSLPGNVGPGQTVDLSVGMVAPTSPGTYTSEWMFALANPPAGVGSLLGLGSGRSQPLFARIVVGPTPTPTTPPVSATRIEFATGATHAGLTDQVVRAGAVRSYVVWAERDQYLMASFASAVSDLRLRFVNARNGAVLLAVDGSEGKVRLPESGDYYIQVLGSSSQDASFTLGVTIPRRVTFQPGAISATLEGRASNRTPVSYLLRAQAGQTLTVKLSNFPAAALALTIYGFEDGQVLLRSDFGLTEWSGILNATQDYMIMVVPSVDTANYTIQFIAQ